MSRIHQPASCARRGRFLRLPGGHRPGCGETPALPGRCHAITIAVALAFMTGGILVSGPPLPAETVPTFHRTRFSELAVDRQYAVRALGRASADYEDARENDGDTTTTLEALESSQCGLRAVDLTRHFSNRYAATQTDFLPTLLEAAYNAYLEDPTTCDDYCNKLEGWLTDPPVQFLQEQISNNP